jgi:hypothetical protein
VAPRLIRDLELRLAGRAAVVLAGIAVALLLYLSRHLSFYQDEWYFIIFRRGWDPGAFLAPNGEAPAVLLLAIYKPLLAVFGIHSYLPYMSVLLAMHAAAALLLFVLMRRRAGQVPALLGTAMVLFLGAGADVLFWAVQIGYTGSIICGLLALLLVEKQSRSRYRLAAIATAILGSLLFSAVGIAFLVAVATELAVDRRRRRQLGAAIVAAILFGSWFLLFGRLGLGSHGARFGIGSLLVLSRYVPTGLGAALAGVFGLPPWYGVAVLPLGSAALVYWFVRRRPDARTIGLLSGLVTIYVAAGLIRSHLGETQALSSRYIYVAAFFLVPILADAAGDIPWRGWWRPAIAVILVASTALSLVELHRNQGIWEQKVAFQDAELQVAATFRGSPDLNLDADIDPQLFPMIRPRGFFAAVDSLGSPLPRLSPKQLSGLPAAAVNTSIVRLFGDAIHVEPATVSSPSTQCVGTNDTQAPREVASGGSLVVVSENGGSANLYIWFAGTEPSAPPHELQLQRSAPVRVTLPQLASGSEWKVRLENALVCEGAGVGG